MSEYMVEEEMLSRVVSLATGTKIDEKTFTIALLTPNPYGTITSFTAPSSSLPGAVIDVVSTFRNDNSMYGFTFRLDLVDADTGALIVSSANYILGPSGTQTGVKLSFTMPNKTFRGRLELYAWW